MSIAPAAKYTRVANPKPIITSPKLESSRLDPLQYSKQPQQIFRFKSRDHHDPISVGCDYLQCLTPACRCLRHNFHFQQSLLRLPVTAFSPQNNFAECLIQCPAADKTLVVFARSAGKSRSTPLSLLGCRRVRPVFAGPFSMLTSLQLSPCPIQDGANRTRTIKIPFNVQVSVVVPTPRKRICEQFSRWMPIFPPSVQTLSKTHSSLPWI
jgi:hypothetical protein